MLNKNNFQQLKEKHLPILSQYVPIVARVHGKEHPEFLNVKKVFDSIFKKLKQSEVSELNTDFQELRTITNNYTIPEDVCESYEAVYEMLSELDTAYHE